MFFQVGFLLPPGQYNRESGRAYRHYSHAAPQPLATMVRNCDFTHENQPSVAVADADHLVFRAMKRRDLLLRRYWRREEDGTYGTFSTENHCKLKLAKHVPHAYCSVSSAAVILYMSAPALKVRAVSLKKKSRS